MEQFSSCLRKQEEIRRLFAHATTPEATYQKIIELGRELPPYPEELKREDKIVTGCQSILYLSASLHEGGVRFLSHSEALITSGLAYLLLFVYNDQSPEAILKCPPQFLEDLGIPNALSPNRSNGLSSLFLRMQQEALKFLIYEKIN